MPQSLSRKSFLKFVSAGTAGLVLLNPLLNAQQVAAKAKGEKDPPLTADLVKEFVIACHGNFEKTKSMLAETPALLNACWDWGGGDFETGIEGAGHVGNKQIAQFLISNGARMNIFCAAMLGQTDIVKSILTSFPDLKTSKGPHGLQLLHHAKKGGDDSKEVLEYLEKLGSS